MVTIFIKYYLLPEDKSDAALVVLATTEDQEIVGEKASTNFRVV